MHLAIWPDQESRNRDLVKDASCKEPHETGKAALKNKPHDFGSIKRGQNLDSCQSNIDTDQCLIKAKNKKGEHEAPEKHLSRRHSIRK